MRRLFSRDQEMGRVIDSWLAVAVCCAGGGKGELEGAPWVLWLDRAADGEVRAPGYLKPLLWGHGDPISGGHRDHWLSQQVCKPKVERCGR